MFDVAWKNDEISTLAIHDGFRLDNELSAGDVAKFLIKSESKTYGGVYLIIGKTFGTMKIRKVFIKSVFCGQYFFLR